MKDFSLRELVTSLNTVESYINWSSLGKTGFYETVSKLKFITFYKFYVTDNAKAQIAEMQANDTAQQTAEDEFKKVRADVDFLLLNSGAEVLA